VFVSPKVSDVDLETHVTPTFPHAKLVLLYADSDKTLSAAGEQARDRISKLIRAVIASGVLHPEGTIVVGIPHPVYEHFHKWSGELVRLGNWLRLLKSLIWLENIDIMPVGSDVVSRFGASIAVAKGAALEHFGRMLRI